MSANMNSAYSFSTGSALAQRLIPAFPNELSVYDKEYVLFHTLITTSHSICSTCKWRVVTHFTDIYKHDHSVNFHLTPAHLDATLLPHQPEPVREAINTLKLSFDTIAPNDLHHLVRTWLVRLWRAQESGLLLARLGPKGDEVGAELGFKIFLAAEPRYEPVDLLLDHKDFDRDFVQAHAKRLYAAALGAHYTLPVFDTTVDHVTGATTTVQRVCTCPDANWWGEAWAAVGARYEDSPKPTYEDSLDKLGRDLASPLGMGRYFHHSIAEKINQHMHRFEGPDMIGRLVAMFADAEFQAALEPLRVRARQDFDDASAQAQAEFEISRAALTLVGMAARNKPAPATDTEMLGRLKGPGVPVGRGNAPSAVGVYMAGGAAFSREQQACHVQQWVDFDAKRHLWQDGDHLVGYQAPTAPVPFMVSWGYDYGGPGV